MSVLAAFLIGFIFGFLIIAKSVERAMNKNIKSGYIKDSDYNVYRVTPVIPEEKDLE